jgi:glutamine synthetase
MRAVRNGMTAAEIPVECSKGEWGRGQHEVNLVYDEALAMADKHVIFKQGMKEMAARQGRAVTFMPKITAEEVGSSCHIHVSLWRHKKNAFWDGKARGASKIFRQFLGGLLKYSSELCYCFAPTINAYKRYQSASWAPTKMAWSHDNRTVGFRVVGDAEAFRIENRMPGADANPYLAYAAMLAAGMAGLEENLICGEAYHGNAYVDRQLPDLPKTLRDAVERFDRSAVARRAFGDDVVDFYARTGRMEAEAFDNAVTDWERARYFERI